MMVDLNLVGEERKSLVSQGPSLLIYDQFYPDPDAVRQKALSLTFGKGKYDAYSGRNSQNHDLDQFAADRMAQVLRRPIQINDPALFGAFRLSFEDDPGLNYIHIDTEGWVGVVYLNPAPQNVGGTAFWRHRDTGLEQFPFDEWKEFGFESQVDCWLKLVSEDGNNTDKWDLVLFAPARYNRLVLFNSRLFHSHMPRSNFGTSAETARLIQVFFFAMPPASDQSLV